MPSPREKLRSLLQDKLPKAEVDTIVQEIFPEPIPICLFLLPYHPTLERAIEDVREYVSSA